MTVRALRDVSFSVRHGEAVAVVSANGAGKSTLLLHLAGLLDTDAVRIGDSAVATGTRAQILRIVGYVFRDADDQLFMPTGFDDVAFGPRNMGLPNEEIERRARRNSASATTRCCNAAAWSRRCRGRRVR